jgi:uncharacterized protein (DUF2267 family)
MMHRDDPLSQVRIHARLHGRGQARRVVRAVLHALQQIVPEEPFHGLVGQLPADLALESRGHRPTGSRHQFIREIADELHVHRTDAAFYARVTFEQLNAYCRGVTPAGLAASLPADLRPLLSARADNPADRHQRLVRALGSAVTTLSLRTGAPARLDAGASSGPASAHSPISTQSPSGSSSAQTGAATPAPQPDRAEQPRRGAAGRGAA